MQEVERFIRDNEKMRVSITGNVYYNQRDIINQSFRLLNGKFLNDSGTSASNTVGGSYYNTDQDGFVNVFTRKSWIPFRTAVQGVDLDIKDAKVTTNVFTRQFFLDILKMIYHSHFVQTFFGEYLDELKESTIWYGSTITKRAGGEVSVVDWRNYITEANQPDPQLRRHAEMFPASYEYMMANREGWENTSEIEPLWEEMQKQGKSLFDLVDFWTWEEMDGKVHKVCKRYLDRSVRDPATYEYETKIFGHLIPLETFKTPFTIPITGKEQVKLYGEEREMFPYSQTDLFKLQGRTIALGFGELLAMPEMMYNELFNMKRKLDLKALNGVYVHTAIQGTNGLSQLPQEAIADLDKGTVITLAQGESLNVLPFDTRNFEFEQMEEKIYELMLQLTGISAQGTGQTVAPSTSATQIQDNRLVENKVYEYIKERLHHGLNRLMRDGYAQDIVDQLTEKEFIRITGDVRNLKEIDKILIDNAINDWVVKTKESTGIYPMDEEVFMTRQAIEADISALGESRFPEIKREMFEDIDTYLEWSFVDEAIDMKQRFDTLNAMKNDPESSKSKSKIEDELISLAGLNPANYDKTEEELAAEEEARQAELLATQGLNTPVTV